MITITNYNYKLQNLINQRIIKLSHEMCLEIRIKNIIILFTVFLSELQLLFHVSQFRLMIINSAVSLQHNNNILRYVPLFNSNIFFSSDNDLKRPLATIVYVHTHTKRQIFGLYTP